MRRYSFLIGEPVEDDGGAWVRFRDVEALVRIASAQAERQDVFIAALSRIASLRRGPFGSVDAIVTARRALRR